VEAQEAPVVKLKPEAVLQPGGRVSALIIVANPPKTNTATETNKIIFFIFIN
jgi:hypothetical protein